MVGRLGSHFQGADRRALPLGPRQFAEPSEQSDEAPSILVAVAKQIGPELRLGEFGELSPLEKKPFEFQARHLAVVECLCSENPRSNRPRAQAEGSRGTR